MECPGRDAVVNGPVPYTDIPTQSSLAAPDPEHGGRPRRKSSRASRSPLADRESDGEDDGGDDDAFGDDFDDFEEGDEDEDFDDFEDGFQQPDPSEQTPHAPQHTILPFVSSRRLPKDKPLKLTRLAADTRF